MKFKKLVSAISALAMSASVFVGLAITADAATPLYTATYDTAVVDWTAGSSSISWMDGGYVKHTGSGNGNRGARAVATTKLTEGIGKVSFDFNISDNYGQSGRAVSQIALGSGSESLGNSTIDTNNSIFSMTTPTYAATRHDGTYCINGDTTNTVTISYGTWYTITATVDMTEKTAAVVVAPRDGGDAIYNATNSFTASSVGSIYSLWPRSGPAVYYDNFKIEQLAIPAFTLSAEEAELALNETTEITVSDIVGDITVESSDSSIAAVSYDNGVITITGVSDGSTLVTVTATNDGLTETKEIVVRAGSAVAYTPEITSVAITGDDITDYAELQPTTTYTAAVLDQREAEMPGEDVVWSVSPADSGVTVADGVVTVAPTTAAGTYTVTATSETDSSVSASKTITLSRVRNITYQGLNVTYLCGGNVNNSDSVTFSAKKNAGEIMVIEFDIYVASGETFDLYYTSTSGSVGPRFRFDASSADGWVYMRKDDDGQMVGINSSDAYSKFKSDKWVHITIETPFTGTATIGNSKISATTVGSDTSAFNQGDRVRYPNQTRTIGGRHLTGKTFNKIDFTGGTVTNLAMYTKAANVTIDAPNASIIGLTEGYIAQNTYTATITADLGYELTGVTVDGEAVAANEDGTYTIVVDGDTAIAVTTTAKTDTWVFEEIPLTEWLSSELFFTYGTKAEDGTVTPETTTTGIVLENFLTTVAGVEDVPTFAGEGLVNFAIVVLEDEEGIGLADVFLKKPETAVTLFSTEFEANAEIEDSEYLELGDMDFDIE